MATTVTKTIRASGGDYSLLSSWEAAVPTDLVTADEQWIAECYNDWPTGLTDRATIAARTTDATRNIIIRASSSDGTQGRSKNLGDPSTGFKIKYSVNWNDVILLQSNYVTIKDIIVEKTGNGDAIDLNSKIATIDGVIATGTQSNALNAGINNIQTNSAVIKSVSIGSSNGLLILNWNSPNIYNTIASSGVYGFYKEASKGTGHTLKNCVGYNNTTDFNLDAGTSDANNASSDTTATGSSPVTGIVSTDFADAANDDYHLSADSNLIGAGTNLYSDFTTDIDGDTWPSSGAWDIGFDYYVSTGQEQTVNLVTETVTVLALDIVQSQTVGLVTESETVLQPSAEKSAAVALVQETESVLSVSAEKSAIVDLITESEIVLQPSAEKSGTVNLVTETDTVLGLSGEQSQIVGLVTETETVLQAIAEKAGTVSLVTESESVLEASAEKSKTVDLVSDSETVLSLAGINTQTVSLVTESETVLTASAEKSGTVDIVTESESVFDAYAQRLQTVSLVTESETVQTLAFDLSQTVGLVAETDAVLALDSNLLLIVAQSKTLNLRAKNKTLNLRAKNKTLTLRI